MHTHILHTHTRTHTQKRPWLTHHNLPAQCLHPGVMVDLADSDDEDCPFHPLENPVTTVTQGSLAECLFPGCCVNMPILHSDSKIFVCIETGHV